MKHLRTIVHSKTVLLLGVAVALAVPAVTLPRLPSVSPWPILLGLLPWMIGKYVLCPLRWRALTNADFGRRWFLRAYAESELLGLLTPGHVGADLWRIRRLTHADVPRGDAVASVAVDRTVGAVGLAMFVVFAGSALPWRMMLTALGIGLAFVVGFLVVRRVRPKLLPLGPLPPPKKFAHALALSAAYQASIAMLLLGTLGATGYTLSPLELLGAFGASQVAGAVPGPNGASPRDGALVVGLVALGVPWTAAAAAVTLKAAVAWLPALALGGASLIATRRMIRHTAAA
ncbi:lysylphosphatidylglycerol synthase domain-containing protein [Nocardioides sp. Soil796]|uniref:lysylphosphatidylglycerol synthase domain-containing protein n=1 Tax=Nocardioides sp. Soil796 TaxID=1736412 RepID=UPI000A3DAD82|nr:lysylphosphatidylglycerol synthase domain-containing protein [Nocardioides sp. Soil796]